MTTETNTQTRSIDELTNHGMVKFNIGNGTCNLSQVMMFCAKAIDILNNGHDVNFLFHEDHFDFVLADCRGNEYVRCVRTGESSIYSGTESTFVVWAKYDVFKKLKTTVNA